MDYFLVKPNPAYTDAPLLLNFCEKLNHRHFYLDQSFNIPPRTVVQIQPNEYMDFTDYLYQFAPLFSRKAMEIIWQFDDDFFYKEIILFSPKDGLDSMYYLPFFPRFSEKVILEPEPTCILEKLYNGIIIKLQMPYVLPVFYVFRQEKCLLFMRLDVIESLLRNGARGFMLLPATVQGG